MSLGEERVRIKFNPSANSMVEEIKQKSAGLIDLCHHLAQQATTSEQARLWALAMTDYEAAAMWAVKAATSGQ